MRNHRLAVVVALAAGVCLLGAPVVGAQAPPPGVPPLAVSGSPVVPGGSIVVSGQGCVGGSVVLIGVLDAIGESALVTAAATPGGDGSWSAPVRIPPSTGPGEYPVTARCTDYGGYGGYDGMDEDEGDGDDDGDGGGAYAGIDEGDWGEADGAYGGYDGRGSFDYPRGSVWVLPPPAAPSPDGALTVTPNVVPVGGTAVVDGAGWRSGEQITLAMYSTPVVLGELWSSSEGTIRQQIRIPLGTTLGTHTVCAMNATAALNPVRNLCAPITVVAAGGQVSTNPPTVTNRVAGISQSPVGGALAFTGIEPWMLLLAGLALVATGGELYRRYRRSDALS